MTILCSACGVIDAHEPHCPFFHQQKSFEKRDAKAPAMVTTTTPVSASPLARQVDGGHYKDLKIQPLEYIHANGIPFAEGCVIKYVSRWRTKGGIKDLEKAKHFIELLIELESRK